MDDTINRFWQDMIGRLTGPMSFRFILQPLMGLIFAVRDGIGDAKSGTPAYLWSLFTDRKHRGERIQSGWKAISRVFFLGVAMDLIYQWLVLHSFYLGELLVMVIVLAILPYVLLRGPAKRVAAWWMNRAR